MAALSACSQSAEPTRADSPKQLKFGVGLQPPAFSRLAGIFVADGLFGLAIDGRPVERIISEFKWTEDQRGLLITLRPGLKWHDGTAVEMSHLKHTIETAIKEPQAPVSLKSITEIVVDPTNPNKATIKLSRPEAFLIVDLSTSTLRHPNDDKIGTGPYRYGKQTNENVIELEAFKDYYRGTPKLQHVEFRNFVQSRAALAALLRGDVEAVHEVGPDFVPGDNQRLFPFIRPYYVQLAFNTRHPALKNPVVRQALSYAVDRQVIVDEGMNKAGMVAEGPIWPYHWAYSTAQKAYSHNLEAATLRLESAGLKIKPGRPSRMPSRLHIRCLTPNTAQYEKIGAVLQKQLYEIGVDLELVALGPEDVARRLDAGDFETALIARTTGRSLSWTYSTYHSSANPSGYSPADKVLDRLRETTNENEIRAAVSDLQQIFHDDPPAIFIAWQKVARLVSTSIRVPEDIDRDGASRGAGRDILSSLWQWGPAEGSR